MTVSKRKTKPGSVEALTGDRDLMKALEQEALQEILEAEMTEQIGAAPGERSDAPQLSTQSDWRPGNLLHLNFILDCFATHQ